MKRLLSILLVLSTAAAATNAMAQRSRVENLVMHSDVLNADKTFTVYLPEGYDNSDRRYPTLYLLHGAWGCNTDWTEKGNAKTIADEAIASGRALPMIIVMPDARGQDANYAGKNMGYFNLPGWAYEDYFFREFIPYIDKTFRTRAEKRYRAISGLSMGGGGTAVYAERHPDIFASACPLSGLLDDPLGTTSSVIRFEEFVRAAQQTNPTEFIKNASPAQIAALGSVRWLIDCGDDDYLFDGNISMILAMRAAKIPVEVRIRNGAHNWVYWQTALPTVLQFISTGFAADR
ncbi:MAG: esterase family protein [Rikenellaceae bacterium]|nr:esterase family protein [Rikenellaceae bacterium]